MEIFIHGSMPKKFDLREGLNVGTVPMLKMHNVGTAQFNTNIKFLTKYEYIRK